MATPQQALEQQQTTAVEVLARKLAGSFCFRHGGERRAAAALLRLDACRGPENFTGAQQATTSAAAVAAARSANHSARYGDGADATRGVGPEGKGRRKEEAAAALGSWVSSSACKLFACSAESTLATTRRM